MSWFNKNKKELDQGVAIDPSAKIEIEATKDASKKAFAEAKKVSKSLNHMLAVENGFTLKIYLAAGGNHTGRKS